MGSLTTTRGAENVKPIRKSDPSSSLSQSIKLEDGTTDPSSQKNAQAKSAAAATKLEPTRNNNAFQAFVVSPADHETLTKYVGATFKDAIISFHQRVISIPGPKPSSYFGELLSEPIADRFVRGHLHDAVRRIFNSRLQTQVLEEGVIRITAAPPATRRRNGFSLKSGQNINHHNQGDGSQPMGKVGWDELGGQHLHFSLYKENKDTMEVIAYLAKRLHMKPRDFAFAGTKDRRAVTVQRVSVYRQLAPALAGLNRELRNARIGGFSHEQHKLQLGELAGNQFIITLRDCHFGDDSTLDEIARLKHATGVVDLAVKHLEGHGFINYYGLQRFGTFSVGTNDIGKSILQGDYKRAVDGILFFSEDARECVQNRRVLQSSEFPHDSEYTVAKDDVHRAKAILLFQKTGEAKEAINILPRKFSAEAAVIRHLGNPKNSKDYLGALMMIFRNLKTMYVHAYQSYVWNHVASERWSRYGSKVIEGDLVLIDTQAIKDALKDEVDENGEIVVHPAGNDIAVTHDDLYERARPLTAEEARSGRYTIFDIVLPTPGFDVEYPANDIGDYYKEFMNSEQGGGLDPADMRRRQKDFSLSGSYRKFMAKVKDLSFEVKMYVDENQQLVETDLQKLDKSKPQGGDDQNKDVYERNKSKPQVGNDQNKDVYEPNIASSSDRGGRGGHQGVSRSNRGHHSQPGSTTRQHSQPHTTTRQDAEYNRAVYGGSAQLAAWQNLPAKLAAEDKAAAAIAEKEREANMNIDPATIKHPVIRDTWIQTSAENEGRRTGVKSTLVIGGLDGAVDEGYEVTAMNAVNKSAALANPVQPAANMSHHQRVPSDASFGSLSDSDGGVRLSPQKTPSKRAAKEISSAIERSPELRALRDLKAETGSEGFVSAESQVEAPKQARLAVIVKFCLGPSQYATMALRELMKAGGVKTYKPDFSGSR